MNKLSDRDKNLLLILVILLIGVVYYLKIFIPQSEKIAELSDEATQKEQQVMQYQSRIQNIDNYKEKLNLEKKNIVSLAEKFYSDSVKQEDIIVFINELVAKSGVTVDDISFVQADSSELNMESQTPEDGETDENIPQSDIGSNISALEVDLTLGGSYSSVHEFIRLVENLDKNIIIDEMNVRKDTSMIDEISYPVIVAKADDPNDMIAGSIKLRIFNISSIEDYQEDKYESILSEPIIQIRNEFSPFVSYPWGDWWTFTENMAASASGYAPGVVIPSDTNIPRGVTNPIVRQIKPETLSDFNDIEKIKVIGENEKNLASLTMEKINDLPYKIATSKISFDKESPLDDKIILDFTKDDIKLTKKPKELGLIIYSDVANKMQTGLVIVDSNGVNHYLPMVESINSPGKNELVKNFDMDMPFPIKVTGVYVKRNSNDSMYEGQISLDMLYANYLMSK